MTVEVFDYIPATDLPPGRLARAQHWALEVALNLGASVVLLGTEPDEVERVVLCVCGCQRGRRAQWWSCRICWCSLGSPPVPRWAITRWSRGFTTAAAG